MKRIFITVATASFLLACGGGEQAKQENKSTAENRETKAPELSDNPDYQAGLALVTESDCLTCHKIDEKLVGPAYREIANKYANAGDTIVNYLAGKIINGGAGVWGEVMMTPHPGLPEADAQAMAKYVLLLKK
jgi:cytochrome c